MRRTVRGASLLLVAGVLAAGLGACGDDDDDGTEAGGAEGADLSTGGAAGDAAAFCDAAVAVDTASLGLDSGETTPDDVDTALQAAEEAAPAQVSAAVGTMVTEAKTMMAEAESAPEEGPPPIPSDAFFAASVDVGGYLGDNCDFGSIDVTATNYKFDGIPESVPAGTTILNFDNGGSEFHEMVLMQVAEGEERPLAELMALPEDQVESLITEKGFVLAPPGAQTYVTAELDPGRYVAICFVPVGATPEALQSGAPLNEEDGHFMHGMVTEFEVD